MADRDELVQAVIDGHLFVYSDVVNLPAGQTTYVGILTGLQPVMVDRRSYGTSLKDVMVCLYEGVTFTGGVVLSGTNCDRTAYGVAMPEPQIVKTGVTPGALPTPLFRIRLLDANVTPEVSRVNDDRIRIARLTSYVMSVTNNDSVLADFAWSFLVRSLPS